MYRYYLTQLHRGPLRTTLARFRLGQHWLQTGLATLSLIGCPMRAGGASILPWSINILRSMHCLSAPSTMIFGNNSHGPNNSHAACKLSWRCHHCSKQAVSKLATVGT